MLEFRDTDRLMDDWVPDRVGSGWSRLVTRPADTHGDPTGPRLRFAPAGAPGVAMTRGSDMTGRRHGGPVASARRLVSGLLAVGAALLLAACGTSSTPASPPAAATTSPGTAASVAYQLHMDFFSRESGLPSVIDPQVFVAAPGTPAGTGPQSIPHVAGVTPMPKAGDPAEPLLAPNRTPLGVTRGQWEKAAGIVDVACEAGNERATSRLTGLIPNGVYSVFVVHLAVQGPGRFTPWGDAGGTTNNLTAGPDGTATPTNTVPGCFAPGEAAIVVIWHSDRATHGATPGTLGVTWHNSVITPVV